MRLWENLKSDQHILLTDENLSVRANYAIVILFIIYHKYTYRATVLIDSYTSTGFPEMEEVFYV